jgi:hypothetical protein
MTILATERFIPVKRRYIAPHRVAFTIKRGTGMLTARSERQRLHPGLGGDFDWLPSVIDTAAKVITGVITGKTPTTPVYPTSLPQIPNLPIDVSKVLFPPPPPPPPPAPAFGISTPLLVGGGLLLVLLLLRR